MRLNKKQLNKFWKQVNKKEVNDCWEWSGAKARRNYGIFGVNYKQFSTHRLSWMLAFGKIPKGISVLHKCDNPPCVNPNHLFLGTIKDNMRDKSLKERSASCKLTKEKVLQIRELYKSKKFSQKELAQKFQVIAPSIYAIVHGYSWKYI